MSLENFYSKTKKIVLALPNYRFYHSPSEIENPDKRFVGRKRIKDKLKSIINNTEIHRGIYLITGYRGMGKTSFVNQTINELKGVSHYRYYFKWFFKIFIVTFGLSFINYKSLSQNNFISILLYALFSVYFIYFFATKIKNELFNNRHYKQRVNLVIIEFLQFIVVPEARYIPKRKYLKTALVIEIVAFYIFICLLSSTKDKDKDSYFYVWILFNLIYTLVSIFIIKLKSVRNHYVKNIDNIKEIKKITIL